MSDLLKLPKIINITVCDGYLYGIDEKGNLYTKSYNEHNYWELVIPNERTRG